MLSPRTAVEHQTEYENTLSSVKLNLKLVGKMQLIILKSSDGSILIGRINKIECLITAESDAFVKSYISSLNQRVLPIVEAYKYTVACKREKASRK